MKTTKGKIVLIDDEKYEQELLVRSLRKLNRDIQVEYFKTAEEGLDYLRKTQDTIFLIISDMKMPKMDGLEMKKNIDSDDKLRVKAIPFIFASTTADRQAIVDAYDYGVQGYFEKPHNLDEMIEMMDVMINYWSICLHPNSEKLK